jgi:hypothetical protein
VIGNTKAEEEVRKVLDDMVELQARGTNGMPEQFSTRSYRVLLVKLW